MEELKNQLRQLIAKHKVTAGEIQQALCALDIEGVWKQQKQEKPEKEPLCWKCGNHAKV
jgi:hypothetical protein